MTPQNYQFLTTLLARECGLVLDKEKTYLAESRLAPVARQYGHATIDELISNAMATRSREVVRSIVEAMVTHETFFFRDRKPFDHFRDVTLPALMSARQSVKRLKIWSAAASTGQEAYSLAMIIDQQLRGATDWQISILGTDISEQALERARSGNYSQFEVQRGLPVKQLIEYFEKSGDRWKVKQKLRGRVKFERFNLLESPSRLGRFDTVFCRNVLIYFDSDVRRRILSGIAQQLETDGALYLGGAETTIGLSDAFAPDKEHRGVYRLSPRAAAGGAAPTVGQRAAAAAAR